MSVIYLLSKGSVLSISAGRVSVEKDGNKITSMPLRDVECVVIEKAATITTAAVFALLDSKAGIVYVDKHGKIKGHLGSDVVSWERTSKQMERFQTEESQVKLVRNVLRVKLTNQLNIVRYYAHKMKNADLAAIADEIKGFIAGLDLEKDVDGLRGLEGIAAKSYFDSFSIIFDDSWNWQGRTRRPAQDPINSMLNYGYAFLEREVRVAIAGTGLDHRFGFLHSNNGRKDSLVYDLMELFRQSVIDKFILRIVKKKQITPSDFDIDDKNGCVLGEMARLNWIDNYEKFMTSPYKDFDDKFPRDWIRYQIRKFAEDIFSEDKK